MFCMNYEFNLLPHVGVVAKRRCAAAETAHEGDSNTPSDRGLKIYNIYFIEITLTIRPN